jgi:cytochrome c biogenesis protein CcmG/thiol:disulfide interchange protein DsbE
MLGKPIPDFALGPVAGGQGFSSADLRAAARIKPVLLNFFASWCVPCASEAASLQALHDMGVPIWGATALAGAYKDQPDKIAGFLEQYGNPYARLGADPKGDTCINFGLYGVPESFMINAAGRIAWHVAGPINEDIIERQIMPMMQKAKS